MPRQRHPGMHDPAPSVPGRHGIRPAFRPCNCGARCPCDTSIERGRSALCGPAAAARDAFHPQNRLSKASYRRPSHLRIRSHHPVDASNSLWPDGFAAHVDAPKSPIRQACHVLSPTNAAKVQSLALGKGATQLRSLHLAPRRHFCHHHRHQLPQHRLARSRRQHCRSIRSTRRWGR